MTAVPSLSGGRKVRAPPDGVLGNAQDFAAMQKTESGTETYRHRVRFVKTWGLFEGGANTAARVKSDGKSVRSPAVTQRRSNPTWSKAE